MAALVEGISKSLKLSVVLLANDSLSQNFLAADVLVVLPQGLLGGWRDDGCFESVGLLKALRQRNSAKHSGARCIGAPGVAAEVAADHHFDLEGFRCEAYANHWIGACHAPVGHKVFGSLEKMLCHLVQNLPLVGYALRQHHVKSRNSV